MGELEGMAHIHMIASKDYVVGLNAENPDAYNNSVPYARYAMRREKKKSDLVSSCRIK